MMETKNGPGLSFNQGRAYLYKKGHPRGNSRGYVLRSIIFAEKALGKPLPKYAEVHHFNEIKSDDGPGNLVICQDRAYHALLHRRAKAFAACGNANWYKCKHCKQWDAPENLYVPSNFHNSAVHHRKCHALYELARKGIHD